MRMKKIMIIAVAAIALVACSKTFDHNKSATEGNAIGFSTWAETLTKARTAGTSEFGDGDAFVVEGIKNPGESQSVVFNNESVSTTDGTTWSYTNTRYWDLDATSYMFYAVSSPDTPLTLGTDGKIAATSVTFSGENNDILLADAVPVTPTYGNPVHFNFKHIGALVDLKVKKTPALATATVSITDMQLEKIDGSGKVAVTGYSSNVPTVAWTDLDGNTTYTRTSGVTDVTLPTNVATDGTDYLINTLVVIPQTLGNTKILKISYKIKDAANNENIFTD